jgi:hypothetical protein
VDYHDPSNSTLPSTAPGADEELAEGSKAENNIVAWDRIVRREREGRIRIEGGRNKYPLRAVGKKFLCVAISYSFYSSLHPRLRLSHSPLYHAPIVHAILLPWCLMM